jgi:aminoglycoside/choline kinase family phosphotransferase
VISVVDNRRALLIDWLQKETSFWDGELSVASADASFRRYFRLKHNSKSYIVMDAPPDLEASLPFVQIGEWMKKSGINVPTIYHHDLDLGFMVLSDFGDFHFQDALENKDRKSLYKRATKEIVNFQSSLLNSEKKLPAFSPEWQNKELNIFCEWCLPDLEDTEYREITSVLVNAIDKIPKAFMHRDFHCRNILLCNEDELGVIDFQGAMHGPVTYDLVSLLRDCYVDNDDEWIINSVQCFQQNLLSAGLPYAQVEPEEFLRWFDFTGLQRHLKCVGIFHRLKIRDSKPEYMNDVPRILGYINQVLEKYPELVTLKQTMEQASLLK